MSDRFWVDEEGQVRLEGGFGDYLTSERALELSIEKWEFIAANADKIVFDGSIWTCALCYLFIDNGCGGCPVQARTGYSGCVNTPYQEWANTRIRKSDIEVKKSVAEREIAFLKSLRK